MTTDIRREEEVQVELRCPHLGNFGYRNMTSFIAGLLCRRSSPVWSTRRIQSYGSGPHMRLLDEPLHSSQDIVRVLTILLAFRCASLSQVRKSRVRPRYCDTPSPSLGRLAASSRKRTSATAADNLAVSHRTNHTPWARRNADENNCDPPAGSLLRGRAYPKWDLYHERLLAILWHSCMICSYANAGSELRLSEPRSRDLV